MQLHAALELTARGLPGERAHPTRSAVTVLSKEAWDAACRVIAPAEIRVGTAVQLTR